jgi:hypothetical protein
MGRDAMSKLILTKWMALAPFGRVGHWLGWRWAMPLGTLVLPYHPWIARFGPWLVVALLIAYPIGQSIEAGTLRALAGDWTRPLWIALILAIPLSAPLLQWLAYLFRIPLLQLMLAPVAMVLLAAAALVGAEPIAMLVVPVLYFGWHAVGTLWGRILLRRLQARALMAESAARLGAPGDPPILLIEDDGKGRGRASHLAREAMAALDQPHLYYRSTDPKTNRSSVISLWRIGAGDIETIRMIAADLQGCSAQPDKSNGTYLVQLADGGLSDPTVELAFGPWPMRLTPLKGTLSILTVRRPGQPAMAYVHGSAACYAWVPGFSLFYMFSLTGQGRWQFGFPRMRETQVGQAKTIGQAFAALAVEPPETLRCADPAPLLGVLQRRVADLFAEELADLDALLADPAQWQFRTFKLIGRSPEILSERADLIWRVLIACRDAKLVRQMRALAALVADFPAHDFAARGQDIIDLLNSRAVAGENRHIRISKADLKSGSLPFAGFGLLSFAPRLYARLGELGEPARSLVMALGELTKWPPALVEARDRLG